MGHGEFLSQALLKMVPILPTFSFGVSSRRNETLTGESFSNISGLDPDQFRSVGGLH